MSELKLTDLTVDFLDYRAQFNDFLRKQPVWKGELTTQTSQTIIDFISTVGVHNSAAIIRAREDSFAETAQSDDAIRSIAHMQGIRMTRKGPASLRDVPLTSEEEVSIPPYTQMNIGGKPYFNREQIVINIGVTTYVDLFQGEVKKVVAEGIGTDYQTFISEEDNFIVSDRDTNVFVNDVLIEKSLGGLWNYRDKPAYSDLTMADGRLLVQFGNSLFGTVPRTNEVVVVLYVITEGAAGNNANLKDKEVTVQGFPQVRGINPSNPSGGSDEKPVIVYKNIASGSFGTNLSAVTKSQYDTLVATYPGVLDAITQAQREINPMDLNYMNVIRVAALTNSPWTVQQQKEFIDYMQSVTMYAPRFVWFEPIPIDRDLEVEVYVFNSAEPSQVEARSRQAIVDMFAPQPGLLMTNFYISDIDTRIIKENKGEVSYVIVKSPTEPMIVTAPDAADVTYRILSGGGSLTESVYAYSVAVTTEDDEGAPNQWIHPHIIGNGTYGIQLQWRKSRYAKQYRIYGRLSTEGIGLLHTIDVDSSTPDIITFTDDGSITPTGGLPNTLQVSPIRYNRLRSLKLTVHPAERQQQLQGAKLGPLY